MVLVLIAFCFMNTDAFLTHPRKQYRKLRLQYALLLKHIPFPQIFVLYFKIFISLYNKFNVILCIILNIFNTFNVKKIDLKRCVYDIV